MTLAFEKIPLSLLCQNPPSAPLYQRGDGGICLPKGGEACLRYAKRLPRWGGRQGGFCPADGVSEWHWR